MTSVDSESIHVAVTTFVEESHRELLCIMTESQDWDETGKCAEWREDRSMASGAVDTCWETAWAAIDTALVPGFHSSVTTDTC